VEIYKLVLLNTHVTITPVSVVTEGPAKNKHKPQAPAPAPRPPLNASRTLPSPPNGWNNPGGNPLPPPLSHIGNEPPRILREPPKDRPNPHALLLTTRKIRNEVLPLLHSSCPIYVPITDFDFTPLLAFLARIPPHEHKHLLKNEQLKIELKTTVREQLGPLDTMRRWLAMRADPYKVQPKWNYAGDRPSARVCNDLRRRAKRMTEVGKREEYEKILVSLGVTVEK
jgi:hypothetical protein